ncbi:hypothetical protein RchiOBHm_Chr3g0453091 [Rosa chinensis]|uniref:FRIGIDA-like protein n=1 Tax=Rosa chinensis TaxID=74649 RepID=A0A2P6R6G6_ROSCH|nr:hypothetical protein RchiOBHm_Chr3g0453091 [Rosa chinensis]
MVRVNDDVKLRVEELKGLEETIAKCDEEVRLKKGRISLIQKSMMQCSYALEAREEKIRESNVAFGLVKKAMEEWCCKVEMKERELEGCVAKLELKEEEVEKKIEELELIEKRVKDCLDDVELRVEHFDSVEKSIQEERQQLDALQEAVREGERNLDSVRKAAEEREKVLDSVGQGLEMKDRELEEQANELEFNERLVELRVEEVNSKDKRVNERLNEVQMKENFLELFEKSIQEDKDHLDLVQKLAAEREKQSDSLQTTVLDRENNLFSLQKSVQEREKKLDSLSDGLQRRERELEKQAKELELKQKQFDSQRKAKHLEPTPAAKNASVVSSTRDQSWINMDGRSLQLVMNEQVEKIDLTGSQMSAVLQASSDPAKLVLDAMEGFYPSNLTVENREFESHLRVVRKSCILLLQELKRMSPLINPQVREEAVKLAADWKEKMAVTTDNSWEALGFLRLITTYELTSIYDLRELRSVLAMVSQPEQAAELSRALGITDKAPGTNVVSSIVKTERSESSLARNEATLSPSNKYLQNERINERIVSLPSIAKTEGPKTFGARFAATLSSPNNAEGPESSLSRNAATLYSLNNALQKNLLVTLKSSSDPAKLVLDSMQGSLTYYWRNGDVSSKEKVVSGNITLLKILMGLSTHVGPHLKENATNLASQWKEKLSADTVDSSESLGYLLFIAMYGLLGTLHEDEIVMLLRRVSQHKRSLELCQTHGFANYIPGFIQKLIERKLLMVAVRFICAFKLFDKLPPVPLLKEHVDDVMMCSKVICRSQMIPDEKDKALDGKISDLRAAIQCIKDYNLESEYPSKTVELQIVQLEMLKEKWRSLEPSLVPKVEQEERKRKKPCTRSSAPKLQPRKVPKIKFVFSGSRP